MTVGGWFERGGSVGIAGGWEVFCGSIADEGWGWLVVVGFCKSPNPGCARRERWIAGLTHDRREGTTKQQRALSKRAGVGFADC